MGGVGDRWESTIFAILESVTFISTATGSTHTIPAGITSSSIAPKSGATLPGHWGSCGRYVMPRRSHCPD